MPRSLRESGSRPARAVVPAPQSLTQRLPVPPGDRPLRPPTFHRVEREERPAVLLQVKLPLSVVKV